jgi:hypothetical protein
MPYLLDGRPISPDVAFTATNADGDLIQFPSNWMRLATEDEKAAIGLTWEEDPAPYDQRFFWAPNLPKDHAQLVTQWVAQTKTTAGTLLQPTDWQVIREADNGTAMTAETKAERQAIRDKSAEKVAAIEATTTTEELAAYITSAAYSQWANPQPERARHADGTFIADDPATPENEAWITADQGIG